MSHWEFWGKSMPFRWIAPLGLLVISLGCGGPLIMLPGGSLSGTVSAAPNDWTFTDAFKTVQLETRPGDPYSVNIWGVAIEGEFFVVSGRGLENAWAQHIESDPRVRLRVGSNVYELRATQSRDPADRTRFLQALTEKYEEFDPDEEQPSQALLFRLEPR
jgi:hypothetical protein